MCLPRIILLCSDYPYPSILIHQPHRIVCTIGVRTHSRILVRHRVNGEPDGEVGMVVLGAEVAVAGLLIALLAREGVAAVVGIAGFALVEQRLAPRHVLQMLVGGAIRACHHHPEGGGEGFAHIRNRGEAYRLL